MAGTLNLALAQQFDIDGTPLAGALLYFYQVGTVATLQDSYSDFGLTITNTNPLEADQYGRIPMFYLADGQVHVRLTDASGVVIFDYPTMQVIGPSSGGGGGGGGTVDPTTIASTGDFKWRPTTEILTGWVKANATTIGNASSGASQRANADTQALFAYLWANFANSICPVSGGRGASSAADYGASKTIAVPDLRGRSPFGLDDMGGVAAGRFTGALFASGNATTPASAGGEGAHTLTVAQAPHGQFTINDPGHYHLGYTYRYAFGSSLIGLGSISFTTVLTSATETAPTLATVAALTGVNLTDHAGGQSHNTMPPFMLGSFYIKL